MNNYIVNWSRASFKMQARRACATLLVCLITVAFMCFGEMQQPLIASASEAGPFAGRSQDSGKADEEVYAIPTLAGGDLFALVVGVSKYANPSIPPLAVAARDAQDFAHFLEQQRDLFKACRVTLLTDKNATKREVERFLFYELRKAGKDDTIFIFLSGHGAVDPKRPGEFFFLTYDADPEFMELSAVNMSGLHFISKLDCPRVVMIADACHAGGFSKWRTKAVMPMKQFIHDMSASAGRVVITSSRPEEFSLEAPGIGNSLFTHCFLQGLEGAADTDRNGVVTIHEAYRYAYYRTKNESEGAQHPQFEGVVEGEFPLAIAARLAAKPRTKLELYSDPPGAEVLLGGRVVGKTNSDGSMYLTYLPIGRPIPAMLRKEGWLDKHIGPFLFSEDKREIHVNLVKLDPAVASLEIKTSPGGVAVQVDGKDAGTTASDGRLVIRGVQVAVPHTIQLVKQGFHDGSFTITIPASQSGLKFRGEPFILTKKAPETKPREQASEYARPPSREIYGTVSSGESGSEAAPSFRGGDASERSGL